MSETRCEFLGLMFDRMPEASVAAQVADRAGKPEFSYVVTPNVDHLVQLHLSGDIERWSSYEKAALCVCDSRILQRLAGLSGIELPLVCGSDLTRDLLLKTLAPVSIAVVGGGAQLQREIMVRYPRFGWKFHEPPMGVLRDPQARVAIAEFVENSRADLVFFAIGAPQSEIICAEILKRGRARGVALCVGASLEFLSGAKSRAPLWMQRASLEWLYRLLSEPRRLWRRYLVDGPRIFAIWLGWRRTRSDHLRASSGSIPSGYE